MGKSRSPEWQYRVSTCQRPEEREPAAFSDPTTVSPRYRLGLRERAAFKTRLEAENHRNDIGLGAANAGHYCSLLNKLPKQRT